MSKKITTYVISLNYPNTLINTLQEQNLNPILFNAIDGASIDNSFIKKHVSETYATFGPKSAIGCALSHLNIWKTFLKSNNEYAIVLEDDIIVNEKIDNNLIDNKTNDDINSEVDSEGDSEVDSEIDSEVDSEGDSEGDNEIDNELTLREIIEFYIDKTPKNFDMLYLGSFGSESNNNFFSIIMKILGNASNNSHTVNQYIRKPNVALATHAYVLSKNGALKLIEHLDGKIYNHIDYCIQSLASNDLINRYITTPRLFFQTSTDNNISTNVSNSHPILINHNLSNYYLDTKVKASYITT